MFKFTGIVMLLAPSASAPRSPTPSGTWAGHPGQPVKLLATFYVARRGLHRARAAADRVVVRVPLRAFARAVAEPVSIRLCHHQLRGGAPARHGSEWNGWACRGRSWRS
jgi:hypothetical protein